MKTHMLDERTGIVYELKREEELDRVAAIVSGVYLLLMLAFFLWQLFDVWIRQYSLARLLGYKAIDRLSLPSFRLAAFTFIAGGLGGIVNGFRSLLFWHSRHQAFGRQFLWKYITHPWVGSVLALFAYALLRAGLVAFSGDGPTIDDVSTRQATSFFALGALAGYGSRNVFEWLDAQVKKLFRGAAGIEVPILTGKTKEEAEKMLTVANLQLGEVSKEATEEEIGTVIKQKPLPGARTTKGGAVDITIGVGRTTVPDLTGKEKQEAEETLKGVDLVIGKVSEEATADKKSFNKVIKQKPVAGSLAVSGGVVDITIGVEKTK